MKVVAVVLALFALISCSRDPNVAKKRYLENGNRYYEKGKYKEASIMYRNALQKDMKFGPAYYHLALTQLKLSQVPQAVQSLRRAIELIGPDQQERSDARVKLAEIYLAFTRDKQYLDEVEQTAQALLKKDPNSFDGHRLTGELNFVGATQAYRANRRDEGKELLQQAIAEYRKCATLKPDAPEAILPLARSLSADGQFDQAEQLYKETIKRKKDLVNAYTELYQLYLYEKKPQEAEYTIKQAYANNPKQFKFLTLLAAQYYTMNRRDDMVKTLTELKSHAKDYPEAYMTVGDFYLRVGEGDEAIKQYREGIANNAAKKADYQKHIIEVLMRQGKRSEAAQINEDILKSNPKDTDARGLQASLLLDKGDVQKAIVELQGVVSTAPDNFVARYNLGRAHFAKGETAQARQQFSESIRLRPDYVPPRLGLAQLQISQGEFEPALKTIDEILKLDSRNGNAMLLQSAALMGMRRLGDSRNLLQGMLKADPNSPDVHFQLGVVSLSENKYAEAEESFRKAYQLNPANSRGLMGVVETYMAQNKPDQAMQVLQQESQKAPNRLDFHMALGNTAVRAGKFDMALAEFQRVIASMDPKSRAAGDVWLRIGETYRRKGDLNSGISALQKAREIAPDSTTVLTTLAMTLDVSNRKQEARQAYEATLKIDPRNGIALNNLAFLLADTGADLDQALTFAQRAKQLLPNLSEVSDTLGWIYLKKNLSDNAIQIFRDLVTKQPNHSTFRYHLGMALSQKGDKMKALQELQTALKSNPSKDEENKIRELIAKLG